MYTYKITKYAYTYLVTMPIDICVRMYYTINQFKGTEQRKVKMMRSQDVPKTLTQHRVRVSKDTEVAEIGLRPAGADRDSQKRKEMYI